MKFEISENSLKDENKKRGNTGALVIGFRWTAVLMFLFFYFNTETGKASRVIFLETIAILVLYNFFITLYSVKNSARREKMLNSSLAFIHVDIVFVSIFCLQLDALHSDAYILYFFLIGYCGIYSSISKTIRTGLLSITAYTAVALLSSKENPLSFNLWTLIIRDFYLLASAYAISMINREVKKYDELHKKEFKLARTDKLTGLANRHYFEQKLKEEVEYSITTGNPLNIIIFDLDNFKKFNDTYGHIWGDKLLTLFSDIIKQNIRKSDIPVRYGGEEFLLIIRDLDSEMARNVADRIRRQLEKQKIYIGSEEERKRVTVSCGIAQYPKHSDNIKDAIDLADKALYHAKETGKNTVVNYEEMCRV